MATDRPSSSRRDFLTGRAAQAEAAASVRAAGEAFADAISEAGRLAPSGGDTLRLTTRAMNCDFAVILNPGIRDEVPAASSALDLVHRLETQMTVYRTDSELSRLNRRAASEAVAVEPRLFALLAAARRLSLETEGAFDPTSGPLVALWRECRGDGRIPTEAEVATSLERTGMRRVTMDDAARTVRFDRPGVELNLGAIGKGHALDRIAACLERPEAAESDVDEDADLCVVRSFLLHGGHSSLVARGDHNRTGGWPVGLRNPAFPTETLATLLLRNAALGTSGAGEQFFRIGGERYGHILDPRTGWPATTLLSATVLAPTAAEADALSTAFYVGGVDLAQRYCVGHPQVSALLTPPLRSGRMVELLTLNVPEGALYPDPQCRVTKLL